MPFLVWKTIGKKKRLVIRWNKRINGKARVIKEIYIGNVENLARIIENPLTEVDAYSLNFGITASIILIDKEIKLREIVNSVITHRDNGLSAGDYTLIFTMNRLSDPKSKRGIAEWMRGDFSSTLFHGVTSQSFWNLMDRISEEDIKMIKDRLRESLISLGYDHSKLFVDASNFYTFMEENDIAKKGHNKKHRYDLNQISYYIAANYDYVPLYGDSYPGNMSDSKTFNMIIENIPENAMLIFDRGYNSGNNIDLIQNRKYIGALIQSDHKDLMSLPLEKDSFIETRKNVYGRDHRIIIYHNSKLQKKRIIAFMKRFSRVYENVRKIVESGDSDAMEKARLYLEMENLNETILLPSMKINGERMRERFSMMGKNALFTNIEDMKPEDIIDLYRKRNRVEHCFRIISMRDLASPIYHWTPQKIKVHMFFSYLSYMFLALIYNKMKKINENVSLVSATDLLSQVRIQYLVSGKKVEKRLDSRNPESLYISEKLNLISMT